MNYNELLKENPRTIVIAEAGINHDGDVGKAKKMIDAAVESGSDYVKFQSFKAKKLVTPNALTSNYIKKGSYKNESFRDLLKRLELNEEEHYELKDYCDNKGIKFLSTPFDPGSFDFLQKLGIDVIKVASGNLTNIPLLRHMAASGLPVILSTGMATLGEIEEAVEAITKENNEKILIMHCISWYPAAIETTNLLFIETLRRAFGFPVGYSDHTLGLSMSIAARALGAKVIEKHFTLDSKAFGPDNAASIEPHELNKMVQSIREVEQGLGTTVRVFGYKEIGQRKVHRCSIVVSKGIEVGEKFTHDNLAVKRPGIGIQPKYWDEILGKTAKKGLKQDQILAWLDIANK